jgi:hypothetical protein
LAEHGADTGNVFDALAPRDEATHLARAGCRLEDPAEDLDRRRLPCPVRTDEAEELAFPEREAHALDCVDGPIAPSDETRDRPERSVGTFGNPKRLR